MLNHKQKVKLARKLSGRQTGHFDSPEWEKRRNIIAQRVKRKEAKKNQLKTLFREKDMKDKDLKKKNPEGYKQLKALEKFAEGMQKYQESTEYKIELERQYIAEHEENIRSLKRQLSPSHDEV